MAIMSNADIIEPDATDTADKAARRADAAAIAEDQATPGTALAVLDPRELEALLEPYTIDVRTWVRALVGVGDMPETDANASIAGILAGILTAETSEQALAALELDRAKQMCGDEPGGKSPVLLITGARALKSAFEEGAACYALISAVVVESGETIRFTTGAYAVQAVVLKHIAEGWMPFKARLEISRKATQRGFYPLNLIQGT
jgi:hypothetical protein